MPQIIAPEKLCDECKSIAQQTPAPFQHTAVSLMCAKCKALVPEDKRRLTLNRPVKPGKS